MTKGTPGAPDYGYGHQQTRKAWKPIVDRGDAVCWRCGKRILPGQRWDLGHADDRRTYIGPEHAGCNRADGARKTNRTLAARRARGRWQRARDATTSGTTNGANSATTSSTPPALQPQSRNWGSATGSQPQNL